MHELSGENVHLGVGDINKNTYTGKAHGVMRNVECMLKE